MTYSKTTKAQYGLSNPLGVNYSKDIMLNDALSYLKTKIPSSPLTPLCTKNEWNLIQGQYLGQSKILNLKYSKVLNSKRILTFNCSIK